MASVVLKSGPPEPISTPEIGPGARVIRLPIHDLGSGEIYHSVTHPDVIYIPEGFAGYRFWMACTPYPDVSREQPCIFCSNDGITWDVPPGGSNPIALRQEAIDALGGGSWLADTDFLFLDGKLYCYYMRFSGGGAWQVIRRSTTNGRDWSAASIILTGTSPFFLSPALVSEGGSDVSMFGVRGLIGNTGVTANTTDDTFTTASPHYMASGQAITFAGTTPPGNIVFGTTYYVRDVTSTTFKVAATIGGAAIDLITTNGLNVTASIPTVIVLYSSTNSGASFGAEQLCSFPKADDDRPDFWHMDVVKVGEVYHALVLGRGGAQDSELWYYTSVDKINWTLESHTPAVPYSGYPLIDGYQHYRSTLVPKDGNYFDLYINGQPRGATADDTGYFPTLAVTVTSASPAVVTSTSGPHYYDDGDQVVLSGTTAPTGLTFGTTYYVKNRTNTTFQLSATLGGAAINTSSTGTGVRASRNPWRLVLWRNVRLPLEPVVITEQRPTTNTIRGGSIIVPPLSALAVADVVWWQANALTANRFFIEKTVQLRYFCIYIDVASGNIEVGVARAEGANHLYLRPLKTTGVIACPTAGLKRIDLGKFTLTPGDYWMYFWADNTVVEIPLNFGTHIVANRGLSGYIAGLAATGGRALPRAGATIDLTSNQHLAGIYLQGDF